MLVTHDSVQIYLTTDASKSFRINVNIITNYSSNRNDTLFNATVVFDNGLPKVRFRILGNLEPVNHSLRIFFHFGETLFHP